MQSESKEPFQAFRAKVAEEREILEELRRKPNQPSMKDSVEMALSDLDDAENVFLSTINAGFRTVAEEAAVIRNARMSLYITEVPKRKQLQKTFADYGANAVLIPSD
jgi:hypothetical protein